MPQPSPNSSAQKRALWAVRRRYGIETSRSHGPSPRSGKSNPPPHPPAPVTSLAKPPRRHPWLRRIMLLAVLLLVTGSGVFGYKVIAAGDKISAAERSILGQLKDLLLGQGNQLRGEADGRINVLLIAIGGEGHKGENLADTVMLASLRLTDNRAALLSIPRDLYVQVPGESYYSKINAVHAYGESHKRGAGPELLRELVADITGLPIHYYIRGDFTAFKSAVDAVGGINIGIENSFYDYWHKIDFPAGTEKMNGERALAYVRARYIEGPEGGDFKRAARQQQVLLALREKIFSVQTALDFTKLNAILNSLSDNIRTDMELREMKRFYELARTIAQDKVTTTVLTTGPKGALVGETQMLGGAPASVLKPRTGNYDEIRALANDIFTLDTTTAPAAQPITPDLPPTDSPAATPAEKPASTPSPAAKPTLEIRNGTTVTALAARWRDRLQTNDYTVTAVGNAAQRDRAATVVYIIDQQFADSAATLAEQIGATTATGLPENEPKTSATVLVLLGTDADK